jgi:putative transposase
MPSTHLSLHYHIVFSTKGRAPVIAAEWRERLHAYLGGVVRNIEGVPEAIGGVCDHLHLLIGLRATACLADVVRDVKAVSSRWVHEEIGERAFAWQEGYGAFTVSASQRESVREYIARQVLQRVGPNVVELLESNVQASPFLKPGRSMHDHAHEFITAVVALAQIEALVSFGRFCEFLP